LLKSERRGAMGELEHEKPRRVAEILPLNITIL
jgi:hypothetical protein